MFQNKTADLKLVNATFASAFDQALASYVRADNDLASILCIEQPTVSRQVVIPLSMFYGDLVEWDGRDATLSPDFSSVTVNVKEYTRQVSVNWYDYSADQIGIYKTLGENLARMLNNGPTIRVVDAIRAGTTTLGPDGVPFFNSAHAWSGTNQSNNLTSTALTAANYATARQTMMTYTDNKGANLGIVPDTLIVPPQLEATARGILNSDLVSNAGGAEQTTTISNVWRASSNLIVEPRLAADSTTWYLAKTNDVKPLVLCEAGQAHVLETDDIARNKTYSWRGVRSLGVGMAGWMFMLRAIA
jgi:phage major head subunit gpT-like protein